MSVKFFISYALPHCTTATVKEVFDLVFDNEVTEIMEVERQDRNTGKPFKMFWITLQPARHSRVWRTVEEIEQYGNTRIIYETKKGKGYWWQVRLNKDKETVKAVPRILPRETPKATDKEAVAFSKTPQFAEMKSVNFEILEPGEIPEKRKSDAALNGGKKAKA
jgi:hypothetical protein